MHRTVVSTKEVEKITFLPEDLRKYENLELIINPVHPHDKKELKQRFDAIFKKARAIKIPKDIDIDNLMNEMNDAIHLKFAERYCVKLLTFDRHFKKSRPS